ncbi:MAG: hypothetical protein FWF87_05235 [Synergistaceae bacterium]|nr:hypothetical protein [Synergistaceae bacterium]
MKKTFMAILTLSFAFAFLSTVNERFAWAAPGDSESNPIIITTPLEFNDIRYGLGKYYKLGNNIDFTTAVLDCV